MTTTVNTKGQVTIPKSVRDHLGIKPGNAVAFELSDDGRIVIVKVDGHPPANRFEAMRGRAGPGLSTNEIMALTREDGLA